MAKKYYYKIKFKFQAIQKLGDAFIGRFMELLLLRLLPLVVAVGIANIIMIGLTISPSAPHFLVAASDL